MSEQQRLIKKFKTQSGQSLIQVVIALGMVGILTLVLLSVQQIINKQQYQSSLNFQVDTNLRMIQSLINNPTAWNFTIAANTGLACAANPSTCHQGDTTSVWIVKDSILPAGNTYYDWSAGKGLTSQGTSCVGFINPTSVTNTGTGNSKCPFQFQIQWTAVCGVAFGTLCGTSPMTSKIDIVSIYNPGADAIAIPFNTKDKNLTFNQGSAGTTACSWQNNASGLVETCGNVGIGTTSPNANLDVLGTTILRGAAGGYGFAGGRVLKYTTNIGGPLISYNIETTPPGPGSSMGVVTRNDLLSSYPDNWMMNFRLTGTWPQKSTTGLSSNRVEFFGSPAGNNSTDSINIAHGGLYFKDQCVFGETPTCPSPMFVLAPPSDERLKDHIKPFTKGLEVLKEIRPKSFRFNGLGGTNQDNKDQFGVIAQQLEKHLPELVHEEDVKLRPEDKTPTSIKKVNYPGLTFVIINAIQDLYKKLFGESGVIQKLQEENKVLNAKVDELKALFCEEHPKSNACKKK